MIETQATVTGLDGAYALVEAPQSGCGRCHEKGGCGGANNTAQLFCNSPRHFRVLNPLHAKVGDRVAIGVPDGALSRTALLLYVLPLTAMIMGSVLGVVLASEALRDGLAVLGAVLGLVGGLSLARHWQRRWIASARFAPVIRQLL